MFGRELDEHGVTPECVGQTLHAFLDTADENVSIQAHRRALEGETVSYEYESRDRFYLARVDPLIAPDGGVQGVVGMALDATGFVHAQRELTEARAKLDLAFVQMPAIIWAVDMKLCITSAAGRPIRNLSVENWVGQPLPMLFEANGFPGSAVVTAHERALAGGRAEYELDFGGRLYDAHVAPARNERGEIVGAVGVAVDVTDKREQHRVAEELALLVRHSSDAITGVARDGTIFSWNPAAERLFGWTAEEMIGQTMEAVIPEEEREAWRAARARVWAGEDAEELEATRIRKDGTQIRIWLIRSPIFDENGDVAGLVAIARDLAGRERAQAERSQKEKLAVVTGLAAAVAHDFDDLLTAIAGLAEQLAPELRSSAAGATLEAILIAAERAERLTQGLLEFSRRAPGDLTALRFEPETLRQALLDVVPRRPTPEPTPEPVPTAARILVVEDEPLVRRLVVQTLEGAGYHITEVGQPRRALALLEDGLPVDLLLTDLVMPDLYGDELVVQVRALRPGLPAIVMSGYVSDRGAFARDVDFLAKPFRPRELVAAIAVALAS